MQGGSRYIYAICSVREQSKWRAYNKGAFWLQVFKGTLLTKKQTTKEQGGYMHLKEHSKKRTSNQGAGWLQVFQGTL